MATTWWTVFYRVARTAAIIRPGGLRIRLAGLKFFELLNEVRDVLHRRGVELVVIDPAVVVSQDVAQADIRTRSRRKLS